MNRLLDLMDSFTAADLDKKAWHRTGPQPIGWFMSQRLGEVALHSGDIHRGLDGSFRFPADVAEALAPAYLARLPRLVRPDPPSDLVAVVSFGAFGTLTIQDGAANYEQTGSAARPTVTVGAEPATLLLMATGRVDPKDALARGELKATGNTTVLESWRQIFRTL
jgi:hypothetical protein